MKNAYEVLGIESDASDDTIRDAFRRFSKVLHPDLNKRPTAATEFKELKKAYDTLIDRSERDKHDYALAMVETKDVKKDVIEDVLDDYEIKPKKKKKKKKKKADQQQSYQQAYSPPPYVPSQPQYEYDDRRGKGEFEGIPGGFDDCCDLGGIL